MGTAGQFMDDDPPGGEKGVMGLMAMEPDEVKIEIGVGRQGIEEANALDLRAAIGKAGNHDADSHGSPPEREKWARSQARFALASRCLVIWPSARARSP